MLLIAASYALSQTPSPELLYQNAVTEYEKGNVQQAITLYESLLKLQPHSAEARTNLGVALAYEGRYSEAIADDVISEPTARHETAQLRVLGAVFPANRVLAAGVAFGLSVAFYVYLRRSLVGKAIRALMGEPEGAQLVGVNLTRLHGICFGLGVAMAAVTGSLISMLFELTPFVGLPYTVTALVVVILGGLGNVAGSLLAALLLGVVETVGVYFASSDIRLISSYAVLSLILILKPAGLFGR